MEDVTWALNTQFTCVPKVLRALYRLEIGNRSSLNTAVNPDKVILQAPGSPLPSNGVAADCDLAAGTNSSHTPRITCSVTPMEWVEVFISFA